MPQQEKPTNGTTIQRPDHEQAKGVPASLKRNRDKGDEGISDARKPSNWATD